VIALRHKVAVIKHSFVSRRLDRRRLLRRLLIAGGLSLGGAAWLSLFGERHHPLIRQVTVPIPDLPADLEGLRIGQLSDLHRSAWVEEDFIRASASRLMDLKPDLIALTGDFISHSAKFGASAAAALAHLSAPLGVYGCLGNHDITHDPENLMRCLDEVGIRVLQNRSTAVFHRSSTFWLCGVDDARRGRPDLHSATEGVPPDAFKLLLCHEPDFADRAEPHGFPLQLSGHSHGGQIVLPVAGRLITPPGGTKYPKGLQRVERSGMWVHTNVGLGVIGLPIRFNCPPEISLLTLTAA
jgi:predicted MPP superfamily phosphohydrolase